MIDKNEYEHGSPINEDWLLRQLCAVDKKDFNSVGNGLNRVACESNGHPHSRVEFYNPFMNEVLVICKTCGPSYRKPTETEMKFYTEFLRGFNGSAW